MKGFSSKLHVFVAHILEISKTNLPMIHSSSVKTCSISMHVVRNHRWSVHLPLHLVGRHHGKALPDLLGFFHLFYSSWT